LGIEILQRGSRASRPRVRGRNIRI